MTNPAEQPGTGQPEWDVCIIGGGPAGLAVASELADTRLRVCVVEAGGHTPASYPQVHLNADDPYPYGDVNTTHSGGIGGTAAQWSFQLVAAGEDVAEPEVGCRYTPMQPLDLVSRPDIGTPGWPIDTAELDRWYVRAQPLCGLGPYRYDAETWRDEQAAPLPLDGTGVVTSMFQFGPASAFTQRLRTDLTRRGITFRTDTDALWLQLAHDRVTGVHVVTEGTRSLIRARTVVLAAGGIESTRLLLDTGRHEGRTPGDHAGLVGRHFMEHPLVRGGLLVTDPGQRWLTRLGLYGTRKVNGTYVSARLTLADEVVEAESLLACSLLLVPRHAAYGRPGPVALSHLRSPSGRREDLRSRLATAGRVIGGGLDVARVLRAQRSQPSIDRAVWAGSSDEATWPPERYSVFEVLHQTEQSPDPDHRLRLAEATDGLGRSELLLTWRWSIEDQRRIARSRDLFGAALTERGVGRLVNTDHGGGMPRLLGGTHHHLGTTRMAADPHRGVVDPDLKVHGCQNLYVASGSVFPSGGFVNPTLTVVALALRLGAHLAESPGG